MSSLRFPVRRVFSRIPSAIRDELLGNGGGFGAREPKTDSPAGIKGPACSQGAAYAARQHAAPWAESYVAENPSEHDTIHALPWRRASQPQRVTRRLTAGFPSVVSRSMSATRAETRAGVDGSTRRDGLGMP